VSAAPVSAPAPRLYVDSDNLADSSRRPLLFGQDQLEGSFVTGDGTAAAFVGEDCHPVCKTGVVTDSDGRRGLAGSRSAAQRQRAMRCRVDGVPIIIGFGNGSARRSATGPKPFGFANSSERIVKWAMRLREVGPERWRLEGRSGRCLVVAFLPFCRYEVSMRQNKPQHNYDAAEDEGHNMRSSNNDFGTV
jgi:hypothetical protein